MMTIKNNNDITTFNNVKRGQFFQIDRILYLRIGTIITDTDEEYNAIEMENSEYVYFDADEKIDSIIKGEYKVTFS